MDPEEVAISSGRLSASNPNHAAFQPLFSRLFKRQDAA